MVRFNKKQRDEIYRLLVLRDGEYCYISGEPGNRSTLVIDHLDNDPTNNKLSNLVLLSRAVNHIKNPRGKSRKLQLHSSVCVGVDLEIEGQARATSLEFIKNLTAEPAFKRWLFREMVHKGRVLYSVALDEGASVARCSQETVKRYLRKEVTTDRPYLLNKDPQTEEMVIHFKRKWEVVHKQYFERKELERQVRNWRDDSLEKVKEILQRGESYEF